MRRTIIFILTTSCFRSVFGLSFQDFVPIKHDITRVRDGSKIPRNYDGEIVLDFIGLVERHKGYTAEEHNVTTWDGYNLILHRITGSPSSPKTFGKPVIFLQHGMIMSSDGFVLSGPGKDLTFLLADAGYDVWLGNARGNTYSRSHTTLKPKDVKFWNFSWHEIGTIDLPTFIDYVLKKTSSKKLVYAGHSMGSTASYVLLSKLPKYNDKISLVISLAPVAYWKGDLPRFLKVGIDNFENLQTFSRKNRYFEVLPQSTYIVKLAKVFCSNSRQSFHKNPCSQVLREFLPILDFSRYNISYSEVLKYIPAGSSIKTSYHYIQNAAAREFQEYDYGVLKNLEKYSQKSPPRYNLTLVTAPVALIFGLSDYFGPSTENINLLTKNLPNVVETIQVSNRMFNHGDFIVASDAKELVYDLMLTLMKKF